MNSAFWRWNSSESTGSERLGVWNQTAHAKKIIRQRFCKNEVWEGEQAIWAGWKQKEAATHLNLNLFFIFLH